MSHFTVLIVGEDPDGQLIPFQENNMGDCPEEYMKFHDKEDEMREEYENEKVVQYMFKDDGEWLFQWDNKITKRIGDILRSRLPSLKNTPVKKRASFNNGLSDIADHLGGIKQLEEASKKLKEEMIGSGDLIREEKRYQNIYATFEEFCQAHHGYKGRDEKTGKYGYWENPNAKWDWYQLGGRWNGFFKMKPLKS